MAKRNLTNGPIVHAIARLALPMVVGIIAVMSIALVDTYFVGKLGTEALAALSFTFPVTLTIASLAIGLGAGAASVVSRAIGSDQSKDAKRLATDALLLAVLVVAIVSAAGFFTIRPLFGLLGASGEVLNLIERYMRIWYISMPFLVIPMVANAIIRAAGDAFWPSAIMVGAAAVNIAITPALIFGWWLFPRLEIEGAAWGTLIARAVTLVVALIIIIGREKLLSLRLPPAAELLHSWQRLLTVAIPAAAGNMVNPLCVGIVTALIAGFGDNTVAAFGVATRLEAFAAIPMLALSAAIGPIAGQNWGAAKYHRVRQAVRYSYAICFIWSAFLAVFFWLLAEPLASIFASSNTVANEAQLYLLIVPVSLWGYGITVIAAGAFNAIGKPVMGLSYYLVRSAVLYVPLSWLAATFAGSREVFIGIAVANAVAGLAIMIFSSRWLKTA